MSKPTLALFFGAGAEMAYGLPSGGKFAIDIFRMDVTEDKKTFKDQRQLVNTRSVYASNWLPLDYLSKPISSFGKPQYESLVKGSLENKRDKILQYLDKFDQNVDVHVQKLAAKGLNLKTTFESFPGITFGEVFTHEIKLSSMLGNSNGLFGSEYFSCFLKILELGENISVEFKKSIEKIVRALLELLIGACGEDLVNKLNDGIFSKKPDNINIFDDLGAIFSLDYKWTGLTGLEYILSSDATDISSGSSAEDVITEFGRMILDDIFAQALDYQALIDSNWRYLYAPKTDWSKFCKISIFLHTVRRYIAGIAQSHEMNCSQGPGYYHDIADICTLFECAVIGTTNYNTFIKEVTENDVIFLNGSVNDFYDPYLNKIIDRNTADESEHITVPFIFTQSGVKPLTSVKMSERYVELYNRLKEADIVCVVGYSFNIDDGHINGMFRSLIEDEQKTVYIGHYENDPVNETVIKKHYRERLRLENDDNIKILIINKARISPPENLLWYEQLYKDFQNTANQ